MCRKNKIFRRWVKQVTFVDAKNEKFNRWDFSSKKKPKRFNNSTFISALYCLFPSLFLKQLDIVRTYHKNVWDRLKALKDSCYFILAVCDSYCCRSWGHQFSLLFQWNKKWDCSVFFWTTILEMIGWING